MNELALRPGPGAQIFHRWFVQYNPFYFASALLVLAGAYLVTRDPGQWEDGHLALAAVIQLYEFALIAGAGLLFGLPGQRRPAVILGIVAMAFLFDPSGRTEGLASIGAHTLPAAVAWALLVGLKLALLGRALCVRLPAAHCALWILAGAFIALGPQLIAAGIGARVVLVAACWLGIALLAFALYARPRVGVEIALGDWGRVVLARLLKLAPTLWALMYWAHVLSWCGIYDLNLSPACFAPLLVLLPLLLRSETSVWIAIGMALGIASQWPGEFAAAAALLALGAAIKAYRAEWPRLYVAAALAAYLAAVWYVAGGLQFPPPQWLTLCAACALALLAWRYRLVSAVLAAALCGSPALAPVLPATLAHWGAVSLGAGFLALAAGLGVNWWSSRGQSQP